MTDDRARKRKPAVSKKATGGKKVAGAKKSAAGAFPAALAVLLRSRRIAVPRGLAGAPPEAYAGQPASFVEELAKLDDAALEAQAARVAGYAARRAERARRAWDTSPVIAEIRRRKLPEPARPDRIVAVAFSMAKPLRDWSDRELVQAAREWAKRARA